MSNFKHFISPQNISNPTYFKSVADLTPKIVSWDKIVECITQSEKVKANTLIAREHYKSNNKQQYAKTKAYNGAITPAVQCQGGHNATNIQSLTGIGMVDFDHIDPEQIPTYLKIITDDPHTFIAYITCSGAGIRVFFPYTVAEPEVAYIDAWRWGNQFYSMITGLEHDKATKDASRLSYLSHDPNCYYNPMARPFYIDNSPHDDTPATANGDTPNPPQTAEQSFSKAEQILSRQGMHFVQGQRHHFLINAAFLLNKMGLEREDVINHYSAMHDDSNEVAHIIGWAYDHAQKDHASWLTSMPRKNVVSHKLSPKIDPEKEKEPMPARSKIATPNQIRNYIKEHIQLRHNIISTMLEYYNTTQSQWLNIDDRTVNSMWEDACFELKLYVRQPDFISELNSNKTVNFNPFESYFESLPEWHEGDTDYIAKLAQHVETTTDASLFEKCFRKWLVGMVASWLTPSVTNQVILTFIGGQGKYKSTFFRMLLPPELKQYFLAKGNSGYVSKDDKLAVSSYALIDFEEIDSMKDADLNVVKALVTTEIISERAAYARNRTDRPHIASFCATGNNKQFLTDLTGNRRWLPFEINNILSPYEHPVPYEGLYAQALYLLRNGFQYWFSRAEDEAMDEHKRSFAEPCPEEELVLRYFRKPQKHEVSYFKSTTEITARCRVDMPNLSTRKVGMVLTHLGFQSSARRGIRGFIVVERSFEEIQSTQITDATEAMKDIKKDAA